MPDQENQSSEDIQIPPIPEETVGAVTGAAIGSVAGPIGAVVGGVVGAFGGKSGRERSTCHPCCSEDGQTGSKESKGRS